MATAETTALPILNCDGCGVCCMHMGYPPFLGMFDHASGQGDPEWLALSPELAAECRQAAVDHRGQDELPCVWLDLETRRCRHHDKRPAVCREFEIGELSCRTYRIELGIDHAEETETTAD